VSEQRYGLSYLYDVARAEMVLPGSETVTCVITAAARGPPTVTACAYCKRDASDTRGRGEAGSKCGARQLPLEDVGRPRDEVSKGKRMHVAGLGITDRMVWGTREDPALPPSLASFTSLPPVCRAS
jgi:hypothetical protein